MNADDIARAIVAGSKETGADPLDVALGNERSGGCPIPKMQQISRARAYAGKALAAVFRTVPRPVVAKLIGVNRPSHGSFFTSLDARPTPWWSENAYGRVLAEVEAGCAGRIQKPALRPPQAAPPPLKMGPLPPVPAPPIGVLEKDGFRPAPDTIKKVLRDDASEKRFAAPYVPIGRPVARKDDDFLRQAVLNTVKMTPPAED